VDCIGDRRGAYRDLVGKIEGKKPLGRTRRRWKNNIRIYLQEVELVMNWIDLFQYRDRFGFL
jgi:hypothetical protein